MDIEHVTAKEAFVTKKEDEMLQGIEYLQSPEVEPLLHLSFSYL